jgi:ubiquinone/menaquinone biosynthesis C-methylase UbiE
VARETPETVARETKNILINRITERHLARAAEKWATGRMLDIGCGTKPYVQMFAPYVQEHVGLDHVGGPHGMAVVDIEGTAYDIPVENSAFDTVLCAAVLEHLEEPLTALKEAHRVLRPGGTAIYTAPFIWHLHEEPRDFYRYSKYGFRYLFETAGFTVRELVPLAGFWVTFGQLLVYYIYRFHRGPLRYLPVIPIVGLLIQGLAGALDRADRAEQWTWAYMVVATRER